MYYSQGDDNDYPRDITFGEAYETTTLDTYKQTIEISKLDSISKIPENAVINNNYHGETLV